MIEIVLMLLFGAFCSVYIPVFVWKFYQATLTGAGEIKYLWDEQERRWREKWINVYPSQQEPR